MVHLFSSGLGIPSIGSSEADRHVHVLKLFRASNS